MPIRVVSILPNKMIGVIGEHADFPVERLGLYLHAFLTHGLLILEPDSTSLVISYGCASLPSLAILLTS